MDQRLLEDFAEIASDWFWEMDENLRFSYFSDRFEGTTGLNPALLLGKRRDELDTVRDNFSDWKGHLDDLAAHRPFKDFTYRITLQSGESRWMRTSGQPQFDSDGRFRGYRGVATDVTRAHTTSLELERQNRELRVKEATLEQVERMASIGAWEFDTATRQLRWSDEIYKIYEISRDIPVDPEMALRSFPEKEATVMRGKLIDLIKNGGRFDEVLPFTGAIGTKRWVRWISETDRVDGRATRVFGIFQDVTQERERASVIKRLAQTDALTGLANRAVFQDVLKSFYRGSSGGSGFFTLFLIDIDHFKQVNDFYGHDAGDKVLRFAARQLAVIFTEDAVIARLGGDELAVIQPVADRSGDVLAWGEKIRAAFDVPVNFRGDSIDLSVSVGIALGPEHGSSEQEIMRSADLALYRSKRLGRDRCTLFEAGLTQELNERSKILNDFRAAASRNRIMPHYQPIVDLETRRHLGFEALTRWDHPQRGMLLPGAFACVFEDTKTARLVTRVMMTSVAEHVSTWLENGLEIGRISLNLCLADLRDDSFVDTFFSMLDRYALPADRFGVEITENVILGDREEAVVERINMLSQAGVEIALDDFGTGFASITQLQILPVDIVKIDRRFVCKPDLSAQDLAVLKSIIELGNALSYSTVAEGVETEDKCRFLALMGFHRAQGHLFGRPMPHDGVPAYMLANLAASARGDSGSDGAELSLAASGGQGA